MEKRQPDNDWRDDDWVTIAVLGKPRGVRGELFARPETTHFERFTPGREFTILFHGQNAREPVVTVLEDAWSHNEKLIVKLVGVDSIEAAEGLRGAELCLRAEDREPLPEGEYYYDDLRGLTVLDASTNEELGKVVGFTEGVGPGVLDIESPSPGGRGSEAWQVPFAKEICIEVNLTDKFVRVQLPGGLRDLNRTG
ncbi:MAG: ribosome maturation factor RimM, partial [Bryobacterales bacterium]|nr:ribosome maturation factor RimM [Bryobacterales bacterium]